MNKFQLWGKKLKDKAKGLKRESLALFIAYKDPAVPWYAKIFIGYVVARTFSPIDLIPDFIPVLGYVDDLILTPLGIALAIKMIPPEVLEQARNKADAAMNRESPSNWIYGGIVILIWIVLLIIIIRWIYGIIQS